MNFRSLKSAVLIGLAIGFLVCNKAQAVTRINFATIAPEGTSWLKETEKFAQAVKERSNGDIEIKVYHSSKMGDELDVLRKMRSGQVHAGAFTGVGLGAVEPAIRVMELPFLFGDEVEIDHTYGKMLPTFAKRFEKKDMVLLSAGDAGQVYIFSQEPLQNVPAVSKSKMWVWEGDPLASAFFKAAKVSPIALPITEVITGLQTGMVNAVYVPPMGAIGFQWWTKVKFMTKPKLNNVAGGMVISKKKWATLSPAQQKIVLEEAQKAGSEVTKISRADNEKAIEILKQRGIKIVEMDAAANQEFHALSQQVRQELRGKLFDQTILDEIEGYLRSYRSGKKT